MVSTAQPLPKRGNVSLCSRIKKQMLKDTVKFAEETNSLKDLHYVVVPTKVAGIQSSVTGDSVGGWGLLGISPSPWLCS